MNAGMALIKSFIDKHQILTDELILPASTLVRCIGESCSDEPMLVCLTPSAFEDLTKSLLVKHLGSKPKEIIHIDGLRVISHGTDGLKLYSSPTAIGLVKVASDESMVKPAKDWYTILKEAMTRRKIVIKSLNRSLTSVCKSATGLPIMVTAHGCYVFGGEDELMYLRKDK